jgi:hypothetical protein
MKRKKSKAKAPAGAKTATRSPKKDSDELTDSTLEGVTGGATVDISGHELWTSIAGHELTGGVAITGHEMTTNWILKK